MFLLIRVSHDDRLRHSWHWFYSFLRICTRYSALFIAFLSFFKPAHAWHIHHGADFVLTVFAVSHLYPLHFKYCSQQATPTGSGQLSITSHFSGSHSSLPLKLQAQSSPNASAKIQATSCTVYSFLGIVIPPALVLPCNKCLC